MQYTIKRDNGLSHHGAGRVAAVLTTSKGEGPDGVGIAIVVAGTGGPCLKLELQSADFDDEASCVQLVRLAERIQLMATAAANRRVGAEIHRGEP